MLDAADIEAIAQRVATVLIDGAHYKVDSFTPILTRTEAMRYVRRTSTQAFHDWVARWYGPRGAKNRYSKTRLDLALAREAGTAHTPANLRK